VSLHTAIGCDVVLESFCLSCHGTLILLISASQVQGLQMQATSLGLFFALYKIGINEKSSKFLAFICRPGIFIFN
jgi:hypothetical protein